MEVSNTNVIDAVNKVLENIGERRVTSLNSPVARKCFEALSDSVEDIASLSDWEWCKDTITAQQWINDLADLGNTQRVHGVSVGDTTMGYRPIPFENLQSFDMRVSLPYTGLYDMPRTWTISTYNSIRVNPYPTTAEQQSRYKFYVTRELVPPELITDKFPVPERFMLLLYYRAQYVMCLNHLDDQGAAQAYAQQFESLASRLRDRERGQPSGGMNMFRIRKGRG